MHVKQFRGPKTRTVEVKRVVEKHAFFCPHCHVKIDLPKRPSFRDRRVAISKGLGKLFSKVGEKLESVK
jgi:hypothetical protein